MSKLYVIILGIIFISCSQTEYQSPSYREIRGEAQGTTYSIIFDSSRVDVIGKSEIDSIFSRIDSSLSVWKSESVISSFNSSDSIKISDPHFLTVFYRSMELKKLTEGAFNAQIAPLVKAWGFGKDGVKPESEISPDAVLNLVHTEITTAVDSADDAIIFTKLKEQSIDVNGIAQGYTVDVLSEYFKKQGAENFMIEVGGEVRAMGQNDKGEIWKIGIDKPNSDLSERNLEAIAAVSGKALATSGSYRKFYEMNGKKFSHTINPMTGRPVDHNLLSVSVLTSNCTNADAFATAFMVMGKDKTIDFIESHPELELDVFLIFSDEDGNLNTYHSPGFTLAQEH